VRYFDTAPHYGLGLAEKRLGAALRDFPRDEYVISSKAGRALLPTPENSHQLDEDGFIVSAAFRREWDFSRDGILRSIEQSLTRLDIDTLDIVYLHDPDNHWDVASSSGISTLIELRDQGVVKAIGAGMNQTEMLAEFIRNCDVDVVMLAGRFSLLDQSAMDDLLPTALAHGVAVAAAGVYNSGLLSRAVVADDAHYEYTTAPEVLVARARAIAEVCEAHGVTLPDVAVQFPLRHPAVASVVLGARNAEQSIGGIERYEVVIPEALWTDLESREYVRVTA
jgi:D-threo-aldose 1-dehydrogenase